MRKSILALGLISILILNSCQEEELAPPAISTLYNTTGGVGDEVGIGGKNFGSKASSIEVRFNGLIAEFTLVNDFRINAVVPEGATSGPESFPQLVTCESIDFQL